MAGDRTHQSWSWDPRHSTKQATEKEWLYFLLSTILQSSQLIHRRPTGLLKTQRHCTVEQGNKSLFPNRFTPPLQNRFPFPRSEQKQTSNMHHWQLQQLIENSKQSRATERVTSYCKAGWRICAFLQNKESSHLSDKWGVCEGGTNICIFIKLMILCKFYGGKKES